MKLVDFADLIVVNGKVVTMDPMLPNAQCIALKNGRILSVGGAIDVQEFLGPDTHVIDAAGYTVLPGFSENHMHLFSGAAELDHLQLAGVKGLSALTRAVRAYAKGRESQAVLFAQGVEYGLLEGHKEPDRHILDEIMPNQALLLMAPDHHTAWANTKALEISGILHGKPLPVGNEIVMGNDGRATGVLLEMEAFGPIQAAGGFDRYRLGLSNGAEPDPYPDDATFRIDTDVMRRGLRLCAEHGITSIQNMDGNRYQLELLAAIEKEDGSLPCRVKIPFHYKKYMPLDMLDKAVEMTKDYNSDFLSCGMVKVFYDGVIDSHTAVMLEPYADRPGDVGQGLFEPEEFRQVALEADKRGLQIAVHAIGDGAVRYVLDGYEAAQLANGKRDARHRIEHIEVIHPDDIARFESLGVLASMQPCHAPGAMDFPAGSTELIIGKERWQYSYIWRTLKDAGARMPFASDWPVADINVLRSIQAAVTRKPWGDEPDQSVTLYEAIEGYTVEGAYAEFAEHSKGCIKRGYFADIVILNGDIFGTEPHAIGTLKVVVTICDGKVTYKA
jgi:predicted amidohydrolase YtcJ